MSLKLFYFPGRGRGEQIRLLLASLGQPYEDLRIGNPAEAHGPFGSVPVLHDGDVTIGQGPVIGSYLAKKFKLVDPSNIVLSSQLDSIAWGAEDLRILFFKTAFGSDEDKKKNSAEFPAKVADRWFPNFNKLVGSGPFFLGQAHATHADFAVFDIIWTILSHPVFGESSKKALQANPALNAWYDRINALPAVHSWIEKRPATNF